MELQEYTVAGLLSQRRRERGEELAYFFDGQGYTWREVDDLSDRAALALLDMGVTHGTHLGLWGVNTFSWLLCYFAAAKVGAVAVLLNASSQLQEVRDLLDYADVTILAVGEEKPRDGLSYRSMLSELKSGLCRLRTCFFLSDLLCRCWDAPPLTGEEAAALARAKGAVSSRDTACIAFTSGTTLRPKGVMLSSYSILNNAAAICEQMRWTPEDRMLLSTPFYHCSGTTAGFLLGLHTGFSSVILRCYDSQKILQTIEQYHCTAFNVVPSMLLMLMQKRELGWYDLSSYCSGTLAGSTFTPEQYARICETFHLEHLQTAYGQTETAPLVTFSAYDDSMEKKATTVGRPLPHILLRIWDRERGGEAETGKPGEIQVKGYCTMQGYYKLPEQNASKFTADGWLRTGDIGFLDEEGYCHFCARSSEMIIRGGENISPREIEEQIGRYPGVTGVKVVGVKAEIVQEKVVAFITTDTPQFDCEELRHNLQTHLARYKIPEKIFRIQSFPMTQSGKIDQNKSRQLAEKLCALS